MTGLNPKITKISATLTSCAIIGVVMAWAMA